MHQPEGLLFTNHYIVIQNKIIKSIYSTENRNPLDETNHVGPLIDKDAVKILKQLKGQKKKEELFWWMAKY